MWWSSVIEVKNSVMVSRRGCIIGASRRAFLKGDLRRGDQLLKFSIRAYPVEKVPEDSEK